MSTTTANGKVDDDLTALRRENDLLKARLDIYEGHDGELFIDGRWWSIRDFTFYERREVIRPAVRTLLGNPAAEIDDPHDGADIFPAIVLAARKRSNPDYTLDDALQVAESDLEPPSDPPTKAARKTAAK